MCRFERNYKADGSEQLTTERDMTQSIEESAEGCSMRHVTEIQPVSAIKLLVEL